VIYTFRRGDHHQILRPLLGFHAGFGTGSCRTSSYSSGGGESQCPEATSDSLATGYAPSSCSTHPSAGTPSSQRGCA
jgi:hypothetical protein